MRALAFGATLVVLAALAPARASAYACVRFGCPAWCTPPEYVIGGLSSDLEALASGTTLSETQQAFADWGLVMCADAGATYAGRRNAALASGDGISQVAWFETGWPHDINLLGLTTLTYDGSCIVEADIELNAANFTWTLSPGAGSQVNAYSVVLHEAGHFFGLGHSQVSEAAMYFAYANGVRELRSDDENGICFLYPSGGTSDCSVTGCPRGQMCELGACVDAPTPPCSSDSSCASNQRCNLATGVCVPRMAGQGLGVPCASDDACSTGLCITTANGSVCSQTCDAGNPYSCPGGYYCSGAAVGDCAIGVCLAGTTGSAGFGQSCTSDTDCASLHCAGGICSSPCEPGIASACPGSNVCHPEVVGACGACGPTLPIGAPCQLNEQCGSELCFAPERDPAFCSRICSDATPCPEGFACRSVGDDALCLPRKSGGCSAFATDGSSWAPMLVLAALGVLRRRRR